MMKKPLQTILLTLISATILTNSASAQDGDYTNGFFILNEDWYGHQNSTINWMTDDGEWYYRVFKYENPGEELGCTAQYGTIFGGRMFIMAKQERDPGASVTGGRITVCDARSLKTLRQSESIGLVKASNGQSYEADGRAFVGWNSEKGYVSTSNGVWSFDINSNTVIDSIPGTTHNSTGYDRLYINQCGSMVRADGKIFVAHQQKGLMVIDPESDTLIRCILPPEEVAYNTETEQETSFGSVVLAKDGYLYCSISDKDGMGGRMNYIVRVDPETYETKCIEFWDRFQCYGPANSWYAWTPDCFCTSTKNNVLYWNGGEDSWFSAAKIYRYDIDRDECTVFLDFTPTTRRIYGCSFRIDPVSDHAILSLQEKPDINNPMDFANPVFMLQEYDNEGNLISEHEMIQNYWFPSIPIFPDNHLPISTGHEEFIHSGTEPMEIDLSEIFSDEDDMLAAMKFSIVGDTNPTICTANFSRGKLIVTPLGPDGETTLTVEADSRGEVAEAEITIIQSKEGIVESIGDIEGKSPIYYNLQGIRVDNPKNGIYIHKGKKISIQ